MPLSAAQFLDFLLERELARDTDLEPVIATLPPVHADDDSQELGRAIVRAGLITRYQAAVIYNGKGAGLFVGNYLLLDKLGEGGVGVVFKAQHRTLKRFVAIKALPTRASRPADALPRFKREIEVLSRLCHPNIVAALDADESRGTHYLVLEFVDGLDLRRLVRNHGPLRIERVIDYVLQAARGLEVAHSLGIIHRDIKPANLMLDQDGVIKILDLGLARLSFEEPETDGKRDSGLTQTGSLMGTVDYISPEQAIDTKKADERSDVYSLGCTLFYLLTGRTLYPGDSMMAKLLAHREQPIPSLLECVPHARESASDSAPPGSAPTAHGSTSQTAGAPGGTNEVLYRLDEIFQRMVAKKPSDRMASMSTLIEQLDRLQPNSKSLVSWLGSEVVASLEPAAIDTRSVTKEATEDPDSESPPDSIALDATSVDGFESRRGSTSVSRDEGSVAADSPPCARHIPELFGQSTDRRTARAEGNSHV